MIESKIDQQQLILLRMGIKGGPHKQQYLKYIKATPQLKQEYQKVKTNLKTLVDEDQFLEVITNAHKTISELPENNKVIIHFDNTFQIRAINPQHIQSLTERAFFNSFNLQRVTLNDQDQQDKLDQQKDGDTSRRNQGQLDLRMRGQDQVQCLVCKKYIANGKWIECIKGQKCRGSGWYHVQCAGFDEKQFQKLNEKDFTCELCKREADDDVDSQSQVLKKVKK